MWSNFSKISWHNYNKTKVSDETSATHLTCVALAEKPGIFNLLNKYHHEQLHLNSSRPHTIIMQSVNMPEVITVHDNSNNIN